jgi:hypothetical protein
MLVYRRPNRDGTADLVLDFTPEPRAELLETKSIPRGTSSSRSGKSYGVIHSRRVPFIRCRDCGCMCDGETRPGTHGAHYRGGGVVNCVGKEIQPWPMQ